MWASFVISKKLLKANHHPAGGNSPNLVTLDSSNSFFMFVAFPFGNGVSS
jgi:hypothetical protein